MTIGNSYAVTHPSTNQSRRCLTSEIGRDRVHSTWYGRKPVFLNILCHLWSNLFKNVKT